MSRRRSTISTSFGRRRRSFLLNGNCLSADQFRKHQTRRAATNNNGENRGRQRTHAECVHDGHQNSTSAPRPPRLDRPYWKTILPPPRNPPERYAKTPV